MPVFASKSTCGFYPSEIHGENLPADAVKISDELYAQLMTAESSGMGIDWSGDAPKVAVPSVPTLQQLKSDCLAAVNGEADRRLAELSAPYPAYEVTSWPQQTREAYAVVANPEAAAPLLAAIAQQRGLTVIELSQRVLAKVAAYGAACGHIIGQRQALEDAVMAIDLQAADAAEQLEAITWPEA